MVKKILSLLLIVFSMMTTAEAAKETFSDRVSNLTAITNMRYSLGSGTVRIVLDLTKSVEYEELYLESPSRVVLNIKNAWLSPKIAKETDLHSTAGSKIRIAQFDPSTVRVVIETSAETNIFILDGGDSGQRLVIDLGREPLDKTNAPETPIQPVETPVDKPDITTVPDGVPSLNKEDKKNLEEINDKDKKKDKKSRKDRRNKDKKNKNDSYIDDIDKSLDDITGLKGRIIVLDPGHGGNDSGAIGPSGVMEKTVTLKVALELQKLLEAEGAEVIMTRDSDKEVAPRGRQATDIEELKARCDIANESDGDIFISIHMDSFTNTAARGTTGYYYAQGAPESKELADSIRKALCEELQTPSRGTQPCNFYVVRNTDMPAVLIELAFISNPVEEKLMNSKEGVQKAAQALLDGIEDYFG